MKINLILSLIVLFLFCSCGSDKAEYKLEVIDDTSAVSKMLEVALKKDLKTHLAERILPDAKTAVKVAEAYMFNVYGKDNIISERPYNVSKHKHYWLVTGSLPDGAHGGVFSIILDSRDGQVITFEHQK